MSRLILLSALALFASVRFVAAAQDQSRSPSWSQAASNIDGPGLRSNEGPVSNIDGSKVEVGMTTVGFRVGGVKTKDDTCNT